VRDREFLPNRYLGVERHRINRTMTPEQLEHVKRIAEKYAYGHDRWNKEHAEKVAALTQRILQQFAILRLVRSEDSDLLLARAIALTHDIGRNPNAIGRGEHNQRSFETLGKEFSGTHLDCDEGLVIQYCALFHTGDDWRHTAIPRKPELTRKLAGILRIADALDYQLSQKVIDVTITSSGQEKEIKFKIIASESDDEEINRATVKKDLAEVVFGRKIKII
jgi:hypothetical protein